MGWWKGSTRGVRPWRPGRAVVRNAPFCPRRTGALPGRGSISLEKWTKEHQGLRPLDPGAFYGPLAAARSFLGSRKRAPSVEPHFFSKIEWAVRSARGRWFRNLLWQKVVTISFYPPILHIAPSSVSSADSFPPRGSLRAMLRWGNCYGIFLQEAI